MERNRKWLPLKAGVLPRDRVINLYNEGLDCTLITVVAGPGYGKTVSAAAFANATDRRVVWLHMTRYINDTSRFWEIFVRAVGQEMPALAEELAKQSFPGTASAFESFLHCFSRELYMGEQVVVIVDDYDTIISPEIDAFFESLVDAGLENFCLVVLSDRRTHMSIVGLKSLGGLFSITAEDLKYTDGEVREYFESYGITFVEEDIRAILEKTEGWPLSLSLLATQNKNRPFDRADMQGHMNLTAELFEREYFSNMDQELKLLFVKLSLLPGFSLEIVKEIGGCDLTQATNEIMRHMFIKFDHPARLYAFQNMYREFLMTLSFLLEREEVNRIFAIAGDWFMENKMSVKALSCYMECKNYERVLLAVRGLPKRRLNVGMANYILQCLYELPRAFAQSHPLVEFGVGMLLLNNMEINRAAETLGRLRDRLEADDERPEARQLLGETYSVLGDICLLQNTDGFEENYKNACKYMEHSWIRNRETVFLGNNGVMFLLDEADGGLDRTLEKVHRCIEYGERVMNGVGYGYDLLFAAEAAFYTGNHQRAIELCYSTVYKAKEREQYDIVCNAYFLLVRCSVYIGSYRSAQKWLDEIHDCASDKGDPELVELRDCADLWFLQFVKDLDRVPQWIKEHDSSYLSRFPIGNGRNRSMFPMYLMSCNKYREANAVMRQMELLFRQKGLWTLRLTIHSMRAVCDMQLGDMEGAVENFHKAYEMSWRNGIILPFVEYGNLMRTLITNARKSGRYDFDPQWMDSVYNKAAAFAKRHAALTSEYYQHNQTRQVAKPGAKLTKRELEILDYLAKGMNREEIGEFLGISVNGVKKHITGIYNKLGAVNRADAIRLAAIRDEIHMG